MDNFDLKKYLAEGTLYKEDQVIREEISKILENNLGISLKNLPNEIKHNMSYEYDFTDPQYNSAIIFLQKYLKNNITKLENGESIYSISNKGEDFKEIANKLDTTPLDIIEYVNITIDDIIEYKNNIIQPDS